MGNSLSGGVLVFLQLLKLVAQLLHLQAIFGDLRGLRLHSFLEFPQFIVEAGELGPLVFQLSLRNVVGIL
jgi:hypothetical protein